jgi:hypothetical protein
MLFKDSFTVSSRPTTPKTSPPNSGKIGDILPKKGPLENLTASAYLTDRSTAPGGSGQNASISPSQESCRLTLQNPRSEINGGMRYWRLEERIEGIIDNGLLKRGL